MNSPLSIYSNIPQPKHFKRLANHLPYLVIIWRAVLEGFEGGVAKSWYLLALRQHQLKHRHLTLAVRVPKRVLIGIVL